VLILWEYSPEVSTCINEGLNMKMLEGEQEGN